MPSFESLVQRLDDEALQELLGQEVIRLLRSLAGQKARPSALRQLLMEQRTPCSLLRDAKAREQLFSFLRPAEVGELIAASGLKAGTDLHALCRYRFRKNSQAESAIFEALSVTVDAEHVDEIEPAETCVSASYSLFPYQRQAVQQALGNLEASGRVLIHMPTGSGKTRTAMNLIANVLRSCERGLVIWLAYSDELCEQAASEFCKAWRSLGDRDIGVWRFWDQRTVDFANCQDGLVVAGLTKMYNHFQEQRVEGVELGKRTKLVVLDEAHQAIAPTYSYLLDMLAPSYDEASALLGLSATPGRTWRDIDADSELANFFKRQKVTLSIPGYPNPIDFLVAQGYLARPTFHTKRYSAGHSLSASEQAQIAAHLDIPESILMRLGADDQRNLLILTEVERLLRHHRRILVFSASVPHALLLAAVLRSRDHWAQAVTGATPKTDRRRIIQEYKDAAVEPRVLCNYGVLTTGFDAPATSAALIARPTKSLVLYMQMVGRALRGRSAGGNDEAEVVTILDDNLPSVGDLGEAFNNWEDVWD